MLNNEVTKKWLKYAVINFFILALVFGVIIISIMTIHQNSMLKTIKNESHNYAEELSNLKYEDLYNIAVSKDIETYKDIIRPQYLMALYVTRDDGTIDMLTSNQWLKIEMPGIIPKESSLLRERIGNKEFITYHVARYYENDNRAVYIKVFQPLEDIILNNAQNKLYNTTIGLSALFCTIAISIGLAFIEIRPIALSNEKQKVFINDISHELRTPLTVIKGNIENIISDKDKSVADIQEELFDVLHEVEYMTDMTSGMLSIVRNSRPTTVKKDSSISDVISEVVEIYADMASIGNKSLIASIEQVNMRLDKDKIKQLLVIVLDNALKYTNEGDKIKVKLKSEKNGCRITVSDTGMGVPDGERDKIFDRFYRASNTTTDTTGTGLGLSIAKSIVEGYNGTIEALLNTPHGLTISIFINNI